jgi:UPF0755 protein
MKLIWWGIGLSLLFFLTGGAWFATYIYTPCPLTEERLVFIPQGSGVRQIKTLLADQGLIKDNFRFLALARLSGKAGHLRAGEYHIPPHLNPLQILRILENGEVVLHQVTIPEGMNIQQIVTILEQDNWIDSQRFTALTRDIEFIKTLGLNQDSLEGYLFPDTYSLARGEVTEESLITMMVNNFLDVWKEITANSTSDQVRQQILILASIIEKETADPTERPLIARVFLNRLEKKMRLQSDPTVIYGLDNFSGNLTRKDLKKETPYNTYLIPGLPSGPICNPGKESISAVLHPADAPYYYFVSKNDGTHYFSTTLREHNQAVRKYQKSNAKQNNPSKIP